MKNGLKLLLLALLVAPVVVNAQFTDGAQRSDEDLESSSNWTKDGGAGGSQMEVLSNEFAIDNAAGSRRGYRAPDQADADMYVQADLAGSIPNRSSSVNTQIAFRYQDQDNYIGVGVSSSGNFDCGERVAGTWSSYYTDVDLNVIAIRLEAEGTEIRCYRDVGAGMVLEHTEVGVTFNQTETDGGFIANLNATSTALWDNFEIGATAPPPTPGVFTDDFNRADEILDASDDWDRPTAGGQNINIVGNSLETGSGAGRRLFRSPDQGSANQYVQVTVPALLDHPSSGQTQVALRTLDRLNYIGCGVNATNNFDCGKRVANVYTSFVNTTPGTDIIAIRIEAEDSEIRSYYDIGAGWVLADTETGVGDLSGVTRAGLVDASGTVGRPLWDNYENGTIAGGAFDDWVADIETHFNVDFFASGTTYYFNSTATGTDTGLSDANAFNTCGQVDAKSFTEGDQMLFMEDQETTCDQKIKNDTMIGDGAGNPFYIGVYHIDGSETPGFSGGPYTVTPGGRACLDGMDYGDFDYFGAMSQGDLQAMIPPVNGNPMTSGTLEGVFNWYQGADYDLDLYIEDICVRASGGRAFRFTQTGGTQAEWLYIKNIYIEGTMTQGLHMAGVYNWIMEDSFITMTDAEQEYQLSDTNTQACIGFKGTPGDPDRPVGGVFRTNAIWDSYCSDGIITNSGSRKILIEDNFLVEAGHVAAIYVDRTHDSTVRRNIVLHTARTAFEMPTGALDFAGILTENEESCGSFDWCNTYDQPEDFAEYATQQTVIEYNIVAGHRYNYGIKSQASGKGGNVHTGEAHSAGVYFYNNLSLDAQDRHFTINNPAPQSNYLLRTDVPLRVEGNAFVNIGTFTNVAVERNDSQFETVFDRTYWSSDLSPQSAYDQNMVDTGMEFPLADYSDLSGYMTTDGDDHMDYDNFRLFLAEMGLDPDDLSSKTLTKFQPTANVLSGLTRSALTYPPSNFSGEQQNLDIEGSAVPASPLFGPFADVAGGGAIFRPRLQRGGVLGNNRKQKLSGGLQ